MPLIAKYPLTWRGSVVRPGTVIDALNPDECRRLLELQRARSVVFVPEEEASFAVQPSDYQIRIPRTEAGSLSAPPAATTSVRARFRG